jgi:hypothetical protein
MLTSCTYDVQYWYVLQTLKTLNLWMNGIGEEGTKYLVEALMINNVRSASVLLIDYTID